MDIVIPCELYSRMIAIPKVLSDDEPRRYFKSIYFERKDNQLFAVVTNCKIAAIEYLGVNKGPDEATAIAIDDILKDVCDKETPFDGNLSIVANSTLKFTAIKSTFGYQHTNNAFVDLPDNEQFNEWRKWLPKKMPEQSSGAMYWNAYSVAAIAAASPSGAINFPSFIDTSIPVLITDDHSPNWIGLFICPKGKNQPSTMPDWV